MEWNLKLIFKTEEDYNKIYNKCLELTKEIASLKGKLKNNLKTYFLKDEELGLVLDDVSLYTSLNLDKDSTNEEAKIRYSKLVTLYNKINEELASFQSELIKLGKDFLLKELKKEGLERFNHQIEILFNLEDHVLNEQEEKLFTRLTSSYNILIETYDNLTVNDIIFKDIEVEGQVYVLNHANYRTLLEKVNDYKKREEIFKTFYKYYYDHKSTFFKIYEGIMNQTIDIAKARGYKDILEYKLKVNNINPKIYHNLCNTAKNNTTYVKKYLDIRKKHFKLEKTRTYDRFLNLAKDEEVYTYEKSKEIFFDAISKKAPSYFLEKAKEALEDGRVDVYPRAGKASGAYSTHSYNTNTFIKLNHNDTLDAMFTLAHEAGHSMHSLFSIEGQDYINHSYKIFVAEIASTFNEALLLDYLIETETNKTKKIALIDKEINNILGTFYRQTLFATYELEAFNKVWNNEAITEKTLSNIMIDLYKTYYNIDIKEEEYKEYVWAYIPHFYHTPFYVYQYATSFAASQAIYKEVKNNKEKFNDYVKLLKAGNSMYPTDIVRLCGVDLENENTFLAVVERLKYLVETLEKELNE